jgi:glycerophosphoryl diester phosphodiesterase
VTNAGGRPLLIAHGGAAAVAPEHTIPAYEAAVAQGADLVWLTVRLSLDDQPVVIEDDRLERTTDGRGAVRDLTARQLKRLDAGGWFGRRFRGQRIQALGEVLERFRDRLGFAVHLPGGSDVAPGIEERVLTLLQLYDVAARALLISGDHGALRKCRDLDPELRLVARLGARFTTPATPGPIESLAGVCLPARLTTRGEVAAVRAAGAACYVEGVDEPAAARALAEAGAAGLVTNRPDLLRPLLESLARPAG